MFTMQNCISRAKTALKKQASLLEVPMFLIVDVGSSDLDCFVLFSLQNRTQNTQGSGKKGLANPMQSLKQPSYLSLAPTCYYLSMCNNGNSL